MKDLKHITGRNGGYHHGPLMHTDPVSPLAGAMRFIVIYVGRDPQIFAALNGSYPCIPFKLHIVC